MHEQYHRLLKQLCRTAAQLTDDDLLAVTYYLLLQDRIEEALATFGRGQPRTRLPTQMQYDYCAAYLDLCEEKPEKARSIAAGTRSTRSTAGARRSPTVVNQPTRRTGRAAQIADAEDRSQRQDQLAATEPGFDFTVGEPGRQPDLAEPGGGARSTTT